MPDGAADLLRRIANDASLAWASDRDHQVGKTLAALAGRSPGYMADVDALHAALGRHDALVAALKALRIDANRLCDRGLGGTYEEDCRRTMAAVDAALACEHAHG